MSKVNTERDGAVMTVWLDNPPYNFLTGDMMSDLESLLRSLARDRAVRAVVLTSAVKDVFISHYDVGEILAGAEATPFTVSSRVAGASLRATGAAERVPGARAGMERTPAAGLVSIRRYHEVCRRMRESDKVFVAALNGRALGGGCELALSCDIRIMADGDYEIGQPEILVGLIPGGGGTQLLTRILGAGRALELCLEGSSLTPAQARDLGLVHRLVEPDRLLDEARQTAARLARRSPVAVGAIKRAVYEGGSASLAKGMHIERAGFLAAASDPATKTAMRRYLAEIREFEQSGRDLQEFVTNRLTDWHAGTVVPFD